MKQKITLPAQPVSAIVWNGITQSANLWTTDSAQGQFLSQAGIELTPLPESVRPRTAQGKRHDIVPLEGENIVTGLTGKTLLLFAATEDDKASLLASRYSVSNPQ